MEVSWYNIGESGTKEDKFQVRNMDGLKNYKKEGAVSQCQH